MNDKLVKATFCYISVWANMASVGFLLVGAFQPEHVTGGIAGAIVCGVAGLIFKIWSVK